MFSKAFRAFSAGKQIAWLADLRRPQRRGELRCSASSFPRPTRSPSPTPSAFWPDMAARPRARPFSSACLGDAIGFLISPVDVYWLYGLTLGLFGFLTGWIMNGIKREDTVWLFGKAILAFAVGLYRHHLFLEHAGAVFVRVYLSLGRNGAKDFLGLPRRAAVHPVDRLCRQCRSLPRRAAFLRKVQAKILISAARGRAPSAAARGR